MTALTATTGTFSGLLTLNGDAVTHNINPAADNTYVLGNASAKWLNIVVQDGFKPGGGAWSATSDDRTKMSTKFRPYDRGLKEVLALEPVYYTYNGDYSTPRGQEYVGLSAQAAQKIAPDLVGSIKAAKKPGAKEEDILTINPSNLTYMLILAVQELAARIEDLESRRN